MKEYLEHHILLLYQYLVYPSPIAELDMKKAHLGRTQEHMQDHRHTIPNATVATRNRKEEAADLNCSARIPLVCCVRDAWNMLTDSLHRADCKSSLYTLVAHSFVGQNIRVLGRLLDSLADLSSETRPIKSH